MVGCDREAKKVMAGITDYLDNYLWYKRVKMLKPTERKAGEEERSWNAFSRSEDKLYEAIKELKLCKVK